MKSIADPRVLEDLVRRLDAVTPTTPRRWGTLSSHEMLCHLADAASSVLDRPGGARLPTRRWRRWLGLYAALPWPHDLKTPPSVDPRQGGSRPSEYEHDRERARAGLRALAAASASAFPSGHRHFGAMRQQDWQRWGYRHTDHHLRQFGS
ncbi:MAG: hypothetical protein ABI860_09800 [Gemmatimonadales bacterium]